MHVDRRLRSFCLPMTSILPAALCHAIAVGPDSIEMPFATIAGGIVEATLHHLQTPYAWYQ